MRPRNHIRNLRSERGQILALFALFLVGLLGLTALVVDTGFLSAQRRHAQNAADAAALAGATRLWEGASQAQASAAAFAYADDNGYDDSGTDNWVEVSFPSANSVEVTIEEEPESFFIHAIMPGPNRVKARAVADAVDVPRDYGLIILDQGACSGYVQSGSGDVVIDGGGAMINSDCDDALDKGGNSWLDADGDIDVTGGVDEPYANIVPDPRQYVPWTLPDPLGDLEPPDVGTPSPSSPGTAADPDTLRISSPGNHILEPGTYYGGVKINCSNCTVTLRDGIFIMAGGGFTVAGNPTIRTATGAEAMVYVTDCNGPYDSIPGEPDGSPTCRHDGAAAPFDLQGGGEINVTGRLYCAPFGPPCSGPYQNTRIAFWQDASITDQIRFAGDAGGTTGVWYFPTAGLVTTGGADFGTGQVIVDSMTKSGSGNVTINYEAFVQITLPLVLLTE